MTLNPKVGDTLWCVRYHRTRDGYATIVTKVGKRWIYFDNGRSRCDLNGVIDGGDYSSPGTCYPSKEFFDAECVLKAEWDTFRTKVDRTRSVPNGVTVEQIQQASRLLFGETP